MTNEGTKKRWTGIFHRIKILTLIQLKNKKKIIKTKVSVLVSVLLRILILGVMSALLWYALNFLQKGSFFPVDKNLLLCLLFLTQALSIFTCIFGLVSSLYWSKDNTIIFTFPARPTEVFISKLTVFYISEFLKNLFFLIPFLISFGIILKMSFAYFFLVILSTFFLPLIAVLIGAILSLPLMYLGKLIKRFPFLKLILIAIIIGLVMWLLVYITQIIPRPLRILALFGQFTTWLRNSIISINNYSLFYYNIVQIFNQQAVWTNILIVFSIFVGLLLLTIAITFAYFSIVSQTFEHSTTKRKVGVNKVSKNTFVTFIKKELRLTFRNVDNILNHFIFIATMPFALYLINSIMDAIAVSGLGASMKIAINILVGLLLLTASNTMSATAITSEGSEFVLIKTAPSKTSNLCWAKLLINFTFSLMAIIVSCIVIVTTTGIPAIHVLIIFFILLLINTSHIFWTFQLDLLNPRLNDYAATGNILDNPNVSKSILFGLLLALFLGFTSFIVFNSPEYSSDIFKLLGFCLGFLALRIYLFLINLKVYFERIQL